MFSLFIITFEIYEELVIPEDISFCFLNKSNCKIEQFFEMNSIVTAVYQNVARRRFYDYNK